LIDEAGASLRIQIDSLPTEIDQLERKATHLEIERQALKKEDDRGSIERLEVIEKELAEVREKANALKAHWKQEKEGIARARELKERIEQLKQEELTQERKGNLSRVAEIRYGLLRQTEEELQALTEKAAAEGGRSTKLLKEQVDEEDVAHIVSRWTGIPVTKMLEGEMKKLVQMEERIEQRVIGQDEAVVHVANAIRRSRAGLSDPKRPIGSFLFLGPTGVGKTELARALAEYLFDDEKAMLRVDMSEYMERHAVAKLIGAPPGYVGYDEGGQLTEQVRRRPYAVLLLDEIEKAHPDAFNILLQVMDDGRLTDGKGRTVDFKNVVIIMTSNIGSEHLQNFNPPIGFIGNGKNGDSKKSLGDEGRAGELASAHRAILQQVRQHFKPEFLNRVDDVLIFNPLGQAQLVKIVDLRLADVQKLLADRKITIELTQAAKEVLFREGYDPNYGARPMKRAIQKLVQDPLAMKILDGEVLHGDHVLVDAGEAGLSFAVTRPSEKAVA
jgi:ATP-dependent Clp protease ATP-binding subunit ClpB